MKTSTFDSVRIAVSRSRVSGSEMMNGSGKVVAQMTMPREVALPRPQLPLGKVWSEVRVELTERREQPLNIFRRAAVNDVEILGHDRHARQNRSCATHDDKLDVPLEQHRQQTDNWIVGLTRHRLPPCADLRDTASRS